MAILSVKFNGGGNYMQEIKREQYLNELIRARENRLIKVITGIRRCGKSYLLDPLFKNYLVNDGVKKNHIIKLDLDLIENSKYRNPMELFNYVMGMVEDNDVYYILLDEIQLVERFEEVLNSFLKNSLLGCTCDIQPYLCCSWLVILNTFCFYAI